MEIGDRAGADIIRLPGCWVFLGPLIRLAFGQPPSPPWGEGQGVCPGAAIQTVREAGRLSCLSQPVEKPGICVKHKPGFLRIAAKEG